MGRLANPGYPQPCFAIGGGGGADVAPLYVGNDEQTLAFGIGDNFFQDPHSLPAQHFKIGGLRFDCGHHVGQRVDKAFVEFQNGTGGGFQRLALLFGVLF